MSIKEGDNPAQGAGEEVTERWDVETIQPDPWGRELFIERKRDYNLIQRGTGFLNQAGFRSQANHQTYKNYTSLQLSQHLKKHHSFSPYKLTTIYIQPSRYFSGIHLYADALPHTSITMDLAGFASLVQGFMILHGI